MKGRVRWGGAGCVSTRARRAPERATVRERTGLPPPTGTSSRGAPEGPLRSLARAQMASSRRYVPSQARWTRRSRPARCRLHRAQVGAHSARCRAHLAAARKRTLVVLKCKLRTSSENVPLTSGGPGPGRRLSPIAACRRAKESDLSKHPKITLHDAKMGTEAQLHHKEGGARDPFGAALWLAQRLSERRRVLPTLRRRAGRIAGAPSCCTAQCGRGQGAPQAVGDRAPARAPRGAGTDERRARYPWRGWRRGRQGRQGWQGRRWRSRAQAAKAKGAQAKGHEPRGLRSHRRGTAASGASTEPREGLCARGAKTLPSSQRKGRPHEPTHAWFCDMLFAHPAPIWSRTR